MSRRFRGWFVVIAIGASVALYACDDGGGGGGTDAGTDAGPSFDPELVADCMALCDLAAGTTCSSACMHSQCEPAATTARTMGCEAEYQAFLDCALTATDTCDAFQGTMGSCAFEFDAYITACP